MLASTLRRQQWPVVEVLVCIRLLYMDPSALMVEVSDALAIGGIMKPYGEARS